MHGLAAISRAMAQARGYRAEPVPCGESTSAVFRLTAPARVALYLKVSAPGEAPELCRERKCLAWLAGRAPVPRVLDSGAEGNRAWLLTEALPGCGAGEAPATLWPRIAGSIALALRRLHAIDAGECPFDQCLDHVLALAVRRARSGAVDESDFDPERRGRKALDLLDALERGRPPSEDIVVTHGDANLSNLLFDAGRFSGFVDCGRCGRADRHQDLALAHRSIGNHYGSALADVFLDAYGRGHVDVDRLAYYRLLDEFF